uniref:NAD(P)-binding domain-containing protein n=1 Tax=Glycine max TaxID=3847 RepID=A0A0R0FS71_SOYBN
MVLAYAAMLSSTLPFQKSVPLTSQRSGTAFGSSFQFNRENGTVVTPLVVCHAKKKLSFMEQILDYIEGGPKLRKWYGAPDILEKDGTAIEDNEDDYPEDEVRDAVLVTDGDSEMGQMVILSLIVKKARVKTLVKDKRVALEAFGSYVESMAGDTSDKRFVKKALRGVRTIICPNEGFLSSVGSLQGVQHLSVYGGQSGFQSMMKSNAKKLAEQDESVLKTSGIPYTIIRTGALQDTPGGKQGFTFDEGCAASGSISKEDAAFVCVAAFDCVPQTGFIFEVANGDNKVSDWKECLATLMEKASQKLQ